MANTPYVDDRFLYNPEKGIVWFNGVELPATKDLMEHAKMQLEEKGAHLGILQMRKHVAWYTAGYRDSAALRNRINQVTTYEELEKVLADW